MPNHFERRLHVLLLTAREQQREKDIKHVIACGKRSDDIEAQNRVTIGNFHDLMTPWTGSLVVRTQNTNHMVVRGRAQILGHGLHRAIGSRKTDDEGDRLFVLSGGKIVTVDALIGRALHPERCKLKRRSLCQRIADARTVDINALGFLQKWLMRSMSVLFSVSRVLVTALSYSPGMVWMISEYELCGVIGSLARICPMRSFWLTSAINLSFNS